MSAMTGTALDASAFPHLVDNILKHIIAIGANAAFNLRAVSRERRHTVFTALFYHVAFLCNPQPGKLGLRVMNESGPTHICYPEVEANGHLWIGIKAGAPYIRVVDCAPHVDLVSMVDAPVSSPNTYRIDYEYVQEAAWQVAPPRPPGSSIITLHLFHHIPFVKDEPILENVWNRLGHKVCALTVSSSEHSQPHIL
jgi:hypothetical protein